MVQQVAVEQGIGQRDVPSATEVDRIREALRQRLVELQEERDQVAALMSQLRGSAHDEHVGDEIDIVTKASDLDREASIIAGLRQRIVEVQHALERLEDGRYGRCEQCADAIPVERLVVFPAAAYCVSCKNAQERR